MNKKIDLSKFLNVPCVYALYEFWRLDVVDLSKLARENDCLSYRNSHYRSIKMKSNPRSGSSCSGIN